jgi:hypothetical protein
VGEKFCRRIQKSKCWRTEKKIVVTNGTVDDCAAAVDEDGFITVCLALWQQNKNLGLC